MINKTTEIVNDVLNRLDFFLVDIQVKPTSIGKTMSIYVDHGQRYISASECSRIGKELQFLLAAHNILDRDKDDLEVSSPGLAYALKDSRQYAKNSGKKIKLSYYDDKKNKKHLKGRLKARNITDIEIMIDKTKNIQIPIESIIEISIIPEIAYI